MTIESPARCEWLDPDRKRGDLVLRASPDPKWRTTTLFPALMCQVPWKVTGLQIVEGTPRYANAVVHIVRGCFHVVSVAMCNVPTAPVVFPTRVPIPPRQNMNLDVEYLEAPAAVRLYWEIDEERS